MTAMPPSYIDWQQHRGWKIQCPRCQGAGEISIWGAKVTTWKCSECNGTGEVSRVD